MDFGFNVVTAGNEHVELKTIIKAELPMIHYFTITEPGVRDD